MFAVMLGPWVSQIIRRHDPCIMAVAIDDKGRKIDPIALEGHHSARSPSIGANAPAFGIRLVEPRSPVPIAGREVRRVDGRSSQARDWWSPSIRPL